MRKKQKEQKRSNTKKNKMSESLLLEHLLDFSSFRCTDNDTVFKIKAQGKDELISVLAIGGIDIFHYTNDDVETVFSNFAKATMGLRCPHKYIFSNSYPYFEQQKEFLNYKIKKTIHPFSKTLLQKKIDELCNFEKSHKDRLAYLIIINDDVETLNDIAIKYQRAMQDTNVTICQYNEAVEFLNSLVCFNSEATKLSSYSKLNDKILPQKITFKQDYFTVDDTYVTSLVVNDYPAYLADLELANIVLTYDNVTITFDVKPRDKKTVVEEISQSLKELNSRSVIKQEVSEDIDTRNEFEKLTIIYNDITNGKEQMLYTTLRLIVSDKDLNTLRKRVRDISEELEGKGLTTYTPINDMADEYFGLVKEHNNIQNPYPLQDTFKRQYPFYYQSHTDPCGQFFGYTDTCGLNVFNSFYRNGRQGRNSYDLLCFGLKGSGKSVTLKTMLKDQLCIGNKVMVLDIESEYRDMAEVFGGQVIRMNKRSILNPLQIRVTIDVDAENTDISDDDKIAIDEAVSTNFTAEMSRICTFMYQYAPQITDDEMAEFRDILIEVFKEKGITDTTNIFNFSSMQFPVFSDILAYIQKKQKTKLSEFENTTYKRLETNIKQLCKGGVYGSMFDNYTNVSIDETNLIVFDVKTISEMDTNVYNAQLFNILSLMWAEICNNLTYNKHIVNDYDRRNVVCLIDEAHRFISTKNTQVTEFIEKLLRRTRKYDAGLWFASQSIFDFLPSGQTEQAEKIKVIFQLVQYKVILKQSSESIPTLKEIFGQFTMSELNTISTFQAGEMLMSLSAGRNKIHCIRQATDADLLYCGNAQDRADIIHKIFALKYQESKQTYGKLLLEHKDNIDEYFIRIFLKEVFEFIGLKPTDNEFLTRTIFLLIQSLCKELMDIAKEEVYDR